MFQFSVRNNCLKGNASPEDKRRHHELVAIYRSKAVIEFELDGTIVFANDLFLKATGYTLDEIKGQNHRLFVDPAYVSSTDYQSLWDTLRSGTYVSGQFQRFGKTGNELWLQAEYNPVLDDDGKPYKVIKFASDITRQALERASANAQIAALDNAQAVIEFDLDGNILKANQNFLATVGYTHAEIAGQHHRLFVSPEERDSQAYADHWDRLRSGEFVEGRFSRLGKGGKVVWMQGNYVPIMGPSGVPVKVIKFASDITQRIKDDQSLQQLLEEASDVMGSMAQGDLTQRVTGSYPAPLSNLSTAINEAIDKISVVISHVTDSAVTLKASSTTLARNNQAAKEAANATADEASNASGATDTMASNTSVAANALSEMTLSIQQIAEESYKALSVAEQAVGLSEKAQKNVHQLTQSSQDIGAVVKVINSIAEQTNLLALNATIEAARAGEAGKGFAVVANEVKDLAKETARATEEVSAKIAAIQIDSQTATNVINDINETISGINASQTAIAAAVEEQRAVSADISRTINETSEGAGNIAASFKQVSLLAYESLNVTDKGQEAAEQLSTMTFEIEQMISHFSVDKNRRAG